jgi:formamidopyrimidine-DNA glycosylase
MPELPEVEVLVRHLAPRLVGKVIRNTRVLDRRSVRQSTPSKFIQTVSGARVESLERRGKYLVFSIRTKRRDQTLLVHLGMTGRLYLTRQAAPTTRHATVLFGLGCETLVFEDPRRFGRLSLDASPLSRLGPEPLESSFTVQALGQALAGSRQSIKVRLLDQSVVAGIGNIYASEALFMARIDPRTVSQKLKPPAHQRLRRAMRKVLSQAIRFGSTVPLAFASTTSNSRLFYYGQSSENRAKHVERLRVYDREGERCPRCRTTPIRKLVLAGRSTFYCPNCQG